ncbi:MAG: hypothetical protein G5Z43_000047 [Caldisphaeraceae archaeon]|nr:hypothetical protein [Caldisphaeraceae archaeon]
MVPVDVAFDEPPTKMRWMREDLCMVTKVTKITKIPYTGNHRGRPTF